MAEHVHIRMFKTPIPKGYLTFLDLAFQPIDERIVRPKMYMSASNEVFGITLIVCWLVTLIWFPEQIWDHPARAVIGHFNPCMGWDYAPASYIAVVGCSVNVYLLWRYAFLESSRTFLTQAANPHLPRTWVSSFATWSVIAHALSSNFWLLLWLIGPPGGKNGNWWVHTALFMAFAFTGMLQSVGNYLEVRYGPRAHKIKWSHTIFIYTYAAATTYIALMYFLALLGYTINENCRLSLVRDSGMSPEDASYANCGGTNESIFKLVTAEGKPSVLSTVLTQLADVVWMVCMAMVGQFTPEDTPLKIEIKLDETEDEQPMLPEKETRSDGRGREGRGDGESEMRRAPWWRFPTRQATRPLVWPTEENKR